MKISEDKLRNTAQILLSETKYLSLIYFSFLIVMFSGRKPLINLSR